MTSSPCVNRWPGRKSQVQELLYCLGRENSRSGPILLSGGPATGKTSIVRDVLDTLKRPYAYVSCLELQKRSVILRAVMNQLKNRKRTRENGFAVESKCEQLQEFLDELPGVAPSTGPLRYIVLDHVQILAGQELLTALSRLRELTGANVEVLMISQAPWGCELYENDALAMTPPKEIHFPAYEISELEEILALDNPGIYRSKFLPMVLPMFGPISRNVEELRSLFAQLFRVYLEPVEEGRLPQSDTAGLYKLFAPRLKDAVEKLNSGRQLGEVRSRQSEVLDLELPYLSKYLLLAAYIASRNKATLDRRIFDPSERSGRRRGALANDRQMEEACEAMLAGPHSFPLNRLLAIFSSLLSTSVDDCSQEGRSADVLMLISSLVSLGLLSQTSGDILDNAKYRCNISEEFAVKVGKNVDVKLRDYIQYAA